MKFVTMAVSDEMHAELCAGWVECAGIRLAARNEDGTQPLLVTRNIQKAREEMPDEQPPPVVPTDTAPAGHAPAAPAGPARVRPGDTGLEGIPISPAEADRLGIEVPEHVRRSG